MSAPMYDVTIHIRPRPDKYGVTNGTEIAVTGQMLSDKNFSLSTEHDTKGLFAATVTTELRAPTITHTQYGE